MLPGRIHEERGEPLSIIVCALPPATLMASMRVPLSLASYAMVLSDP